MLEGEESTFFCSCGIFIFLFENRWRHCIFTSVDSATTIMVVTTPNKVSRLLFLFPKITKHIHELCNTQFDYNVLLLLFFKYIMLSKTIS